MKAPLRWGFYIFITINKKYKQMNELRRMQRLAGLITESQLNEEETSLQTYLTSKEKNLKSRPTELAKKITDYLDSVFVV